MLSKLLPKDLVNVRDRFESHPLYIAIKDACCDCCVIPRYFQFRPEHVFIEVITLLDHLKERQEDTDWRRLYDQFIQDYRYMDSDIPDEELECIAAIVCTTLASILVMSIPRAYHEIGELLLQQVFAQENDIPRKEMYELCDRMEAHEEQLQSWIEEYIDSDDFTSEVFNSLFADTDLKTAKGSPEHIKFKEGVSTTLRQECKEAIQHAVDAESNYGKASKVKDCLWYYKTEDVIELIGTEKDIYNDLCKFWGYKQAYNTFSLATPNLGSN